VPWYYAIVEREHDLQNPTSPEKIRLLGERMRLGPASDVLDVASGRGGPAVLLADAFGCRITCVERAQDFHDAARRRVRNAGLEDRIELVLGDAHAYPLEPERYDAALCLGASFVWDGLAGTIGALAPAVRPGGFVAVGEPYWRRWPLPRDFEPDPGEDYLTLRDTVGRFEQAGLEPVELIDGSLDDWDRYESLHWLAAAEWLEENADDPSTDEIRATVERNRDRYLRWGRELVGWAIVVGRKPFS
jgi:SAM-dependent methyltransferase